MRSFAIEEPGSRTLCHPGCHVIVCAVCNFLDVFHFCKDMEWRRLILSPRFWFLITDDWMTQTSRYRADARASKILVKVQAELYLLLICRHGFPASTLSEVMQGFLSGGRGRGWRNLLGRSPPSLQPPPRARQLRQEPTRPIPMFPGRSHISYLSIGGLQIMSFMKATRKTVTLDNNCNPSQYVSWEKHSLVHFTV